MPESQTNVSLPQSYGWANSRTLDPSQTWRMPWWTAILIAISMLIVVYLVIAFAGALQMNPLPNSLAEAAQHGARSPMNLAMAQLVGGLCVLAFASRNTGLGLVPIQGTTLAALLISGVALQFILAEVGNLTAEFVPQNIEQITVLHHWINHDDPIFVLQVFLSFVVVAPLVEELVFRGVLLRGLRARYGTAVAVFLSSLLFALVHIQPGAIIYAGIGGLILGLVSVWTGSTVASFALHASINATGVLLPERLVRIQGFNTLQEEPTHISGALILCALATVIVLMSSIYRRHALGLIDE